MDTLEYIAMGGLVIAGAYLLVSLVAYLKTRGSRKVEGDAAGQMILNMEGNILVEGEPSPIRMRKLADICASVGRRVFSENLDFTVESIAAIDRAVIKGWGDEESGDLHPDVILAFGAYIGEVLVRHSRGRWVSGLTDDEPASILFLTRDKEQEAVSISPFLLVREKFQKKYRWDLAVAFTAMEQKLRELNVA